MKELFSQLRFKGTLVSHVSKPFILPRLSGISKTEVVHKSLRETPALWQAGGFCLEREKQR